MAFNIFKKKQEETYPAEEKAEVLGEDELPPLPPMEELPELSESIEEGLPDLGEANDEELPPPPEEETGETHTFSQGFKSPDEMRPPTTRPRHVQQMPMPPTRYVPETAAPFPEVSTRTRTGSTTAPHIYIKISKYKDVMNAVQDLHTSIQETKQDLEDIHSIGREEEEKLKESAAVVIKIEELLKYLETTFTRPEE
jgi:hypothetical protein